MQLKLKHAPVVGAYPGIPRIPRAVDKEVWTLESSLRTSYGLPGLVLPSEIVSVLQPKWPTTKSPTEMSLLLLSITLSNGCAQYTGYCIFFFYYSFTMRLVYLATCVPSIVLPRAILALYGLTG